MFRFSSIIGAFVATALASSTVSAFAPAMGKSLEDRHIIIYTSFSISAKSLTDTFLTPETYF